LRYKRSENVPVPCARYRSDGSVKAVILAFAMIVGILTGPACNAATIMSTPIVNNTDPVTLPQFLAGIVPRSANLIYISEQDSEVFAFYRNTPVKGNVTNAAFLMLLRRPEETPIFRETWSSFFQIRTQNDSTGRWLNLQNYLEANLTNPTVFQVPRPAPYAAQYDLYAVGIFNNETVVGVQMFGVAT